MLEKFYLKLSNRPPKCKTKTVIGFPVYIPFKFIHAFFNFVPRSLECANAHFIFSLGYNFCIMFSQFSGVFTLYRQWQFKSVGHSRWTHDIESNFVFLCSFSSKFHSKLSNSKDPCPCQGTNFNEHCLNLVAQRRNRTLQCAANVQVVQIWLKCDEIERTKLKLVDHWRIWMKNDEIHFEVFTYQSS